MGEAGFKDGLGKGDGREGEAHLWKLVACRSRSRALRILSSRAFAFFSSRLELACLFSCRTAWSCRARSTTTERCLSAMMGSGHCLGRISGVPAHNRKGARVPRSGRAEHTPLPAERGGGRVSRPRACIVAGMPPLFRVAGPARGVPNAAAEKSIAPRNARQRALPERVVGPYEGAAVEDHPIAVHKVSPCVTKDLAAVPVQPVPRRSQRAVDRPTGRMHVDVSVVLGYGGRGQAGKGGMVGRAGLRERRGTVSPGGRGPMNGWLRSCACGLSQARGSCTPLSLRSSRTCLQTARERRAPPTRSAAPRHRGQA